MFAWHIGIYRCGECGSLMIAGEKKGIHLISCNRPECKTYPQWYKLPKVELEPCDDRKTQGISEGG